MSLQLPNETWLEVFRFVPRPILGCQVATSAKLFNSIAILRIMTAESERTIGELAIFEECIGILLDAGNNSRLFRAMPLPDSVPPWNVHIRSIAVYCALGPRAAKFLRLVTSTRPCTLQLDGANFAQQFGAARAWPNNVRKVRLARGDSPLENGRSMFHIFTDQSALFRLLETTLLECDLSEMDYNMDLLNWLNHSPFSPSNCHRENFVRRRRKSTKERVLLLNGDQSNIQQFLRDARQNFANSMEPAQYKVRIGPEMDVHANWTDRNWRTREKLIFWKIRNGGNAKIGQKYAYMLERKWMDFKWEDEMDEEEEPGEAKEEEYGAPLVVDKATAPNDKNGGKEGKKAAADILHISFK